MPKRQIFNASFFRGLQTTTLEGATEFPSLVEAQDQRVSEGPIRRRKGSVRIDRSGADGDNLDLDGSTNFIRVPLHAVHTLGKQWTFEGLFKVGNISGTEVFFGVEHAADYSIKVQRATTTLQVLVQDSAGTVVTLTGTDTLSADDELGVQVTRSGTALTLSVNDSEQDTGTMADLLGKTPGGAILIGADGATPGSHWDGQVDYVRCFSSVREISRDYKVRWLDPREDSVLFDYSLQVDANDLCKDRGRYELTGQLQGTAAHTESTLSNRYAPAQALHQFRDADDSRKTLVAVGGRLFNVDI